MTTSYGGARVPARLFETVRVNPYPIRAAIDLGTGGMATLTVARVDARARAIRDVLYHTALPLDLPALGDALHPSAWPRLTNAMRTLVSATGRTPPTEFAAVLNLPVSGGERTIRDWRKEHRLRLHVPPRWDASESVRAPTDPWFGDAVHTTSAFGPTASAATQTIASVAAAARVKDPTQLVVLREVQGGRIGILGLRSPEDEVAADDGPPHEDVLSLCVHDALAILLRDVQRRDARVLQNPHRSPNPCTRAEYQLLRDTLLERVEDALPEWARRRMGKLDDDDDPTAEGSRTEVDRYLHQADPTDTPPRRPTAVCFGGNGSIWNVAARVSGRTRISLRVLDQRAQFEYCRSSDAILGATFPSPQLVVPQAALASAILGHLGCPHVEYLPDVSLTHAMLVEDAFWAYHRQEELAEEGAANDAAAQSRFEEPRGWMRPHERESSIGALKDYAPSWRNDERQWGGGN